MDDSRINIILNQITNLAQGNFDIETQISDNHDDIDGIILGLNMLAEELKSSTVSIEKFKLEKEKAEAASRAKSEFLANMSHEIRTPLNAVIGFTDFLMKSELNETQSKYMGIVFQSGNSLLDLINDVLDFSKIEAGKLELDITKVDIIELAGNASDVISFKAQSKGIEILLNLPTNLPRIIFTDSIRLRQIIVNLLGNAVKFTEKGEIEIKIELKEFSKNESTAKLAFTVRDTGIGISNVNLGKIFFAFAQEDSSTTRRYGGTGLGLTISNKLLKLMGSELTVESELGIGSSFSFTLESKVYKAEKPNWAGLESFKNVLVVDDNENNRIIVQDMLAARNIGSDLASNGLEALQKIEKNRNYDLVIMDYHMPNMDGLDVIRSIRKKLNLSATDLPILLLYSTSNDEYVNQVCDELDVRIKILKPIKTDQLFSAISKVKMIEDEIEIADKNNGIEKKLNIQREYRIMIVDDNPLNSFLAKTIIEQILPKAEINEIADGLLAIEKYKTFDPDLILMDVQMPGMNGYDATVEIRKLQKKNRVPIIALTAGTVKGEKEKCIEAGMDDYASKPVIKDTIEKLIQKWLLGTNRFDLEESNIHDDNKIHFSLDELNSRLGYNSVIKTKILGMARGSLDKTFDELAHSVNIKNMQLIKESAHKMKGTALTVSFPILAALAGEMENTREFHRQHVHELLEKIKMEIEILQNIIIAMT